jgi:hypothetical protein
MAGKRRERSGQRRIRGFAVSIGVAAFFLGFAAFISWLAPVHVLELRREEEGRIRADIGQRLLVVIPLQTRTLDGVTGVSTRRYAPPAYVNPDEPTAVVRPEEQGFLVLEAAHGSTETSISPVDLEDAERSVRQFLSGSDARLHRRLVSNWKFGVLVAMLVAAPGVFILLAAAWDVVQGFGARRRSERPAQG